MGAWADLKLDTATLKGLAKELLTSRQSGQFDVGRVSEERKAAARGELEDVLFDEKAGALARYISAKGSRSKLLDAIADESELEGSLQRGFALAFLVLYAPDTAVTPQSMRAERGTSLEKKLERWARSFGATAPHALGLSKTSSRSGAGGAFASTMNTYDESQWP